MTLPIGRVAQLALYFAALNGCHPGDDTRSGTRGELGRIEFSYQRSCFFGCSLAQPLLAGTREQIAVSAPGDAQGVSVESSDPGVASFALQRKCHCERSDSTDHLEIREDADCPGVWRKQCDNLVLVQAGAAGEAELELRDAQHAAIDRVEVIVREARDARLAATLPDKLGPDVGTRFALDAGKSLDLALTLYDAGGLELLAPEGVDWHVDDANIATLSGFLTGDRSDVHAGLSVTVHAIAPGDTQVHIVVPGLESSADVQVTN